MKRMLVAPSMLAADFANLAKDIDLVNENADIIHLDIMDGVFVPNISYGTPVIEAICKRATIEVEAHLMIVEPQKFFELYKSLGVNSISVHYEACNHLDRTVKRIKELGMKAGVAINPHTSVQLLEDVVRFADYILIMSVNPGYGGQKYIPYCTEKIAELKQIIEKNNPKCLIEVDGGVGLNNIEELANAGADVVVAGSAVFSAKNPAEAIKKLQGLR
ncbi:MAG: ribulose-phosphate 3-epimerase [Bacteroidales bacterium]|nr:ribulose-phosphate 3-epimerase [Bacteroidales bacterium]MBP5517384.1 ribulose-phosphate 3-epimerase [Bacteroidales bacterium]